ncbi:MAG TPA: hypothetical protein PKV75_12065, partial [Desulfobacterales bacterium]|nr:hypothetical protein [Desulfobacterales bacterium]
SPRALPDGLILVFQHPVKYPDKIFQYSGLNHPEARETEASTARQRYNRMISGEKDYGSDFTAS